jgi:aconitate hydratase
LLAKLIRAGARLHQAGCNGCIGMGQAPATGRLSVRTVPRNFPGRSGTPEDQVYLCSPETAAASALTGVITDPRSLNVPYPRFDEPDRLIMNSEMLIPPAPAGEYVELVKGPNIQSLPSLEPLPDSMEGPVLLKLGDNISTDEIMPAGEQVLPYRSNIPAISRFIFRGVDRTYYERAMRHQQSGSFIVGGRNYGQGSSREHAAIGPRYLGAKAVIAKSFARIHRQNLINFGILPLTFANPDDWNKIAPEHVLRLPDVREAIQCSNQVQILNQSTGETYIAEHGTTDRQVRMLLAGSLINLFRARQAVHDA